MKLLRYAAKRGLLLLAILPLVAVFLSTLAIVSGEMDALLQQQAAEEAWDSCRDDEECWSLPGMARFAEVNRRRDALLERWLSEPVTTRVVRQSWSLLTFDWGDALYVNAATGSSRVVDLVLERLPWTVGLFTLGTVLAAFVGVRVGLRMAAEAETRTDRGLTVLSLSTVVLPSWIWAIILLLVFAFWLDVLPPWGLYSAPAPREPLLLALDLLWHLILPLITVVLSSVGAWAYVTRALVLEAEQEDYVAAARGRGLPEGAVLRRHVFRAAAPPIITTLVVTLIVVWNASIVLEGVIGYPGTGFLYWEALGMVHADPGDPSIGPFDIPILITLPLVYAMLFIVTIFLLDVTYRFLDPRIQALGEKRKSAVGVKGAPPKGR